MRNGFSMNRRQILQAGALGLMGINLPRLLSAQAQAPQLQLAPKADNCIIIFLNGGPSHLDMWDMKPDAPDGIRGEFKPVSSSLPGYFVSEHLPKLSQQMHRCTVIRSMHHSVNNAHAAAVYASMTGHDRGERGGGTRPDDNPSPGSVLGKLRPPEQLIVPNVVLPYITKEGAGGPPQPGFFAGYLGGGYDPLFVLKDPNAADFSVPELSLLTDVSLERLDRRRELWQALDQRLVSGPARLSSTAMDGFQSKALELLASDQTQRAFQISTEPDSVRDSYGRNIYGQSVLLARRLIEAGTRMVTVSWAPDANATWDTHGSNFVSLKDRLLPQFDSACGSLIADLHDRGMLERTLVAVLGDFGRSPKINANNGGRDHWNYCYSLMLAGGGIKPGFILGTSDRTGAFPDSRPTGPGDVVSTIYQLLGVPHDSEMRDNLNRPHRLVPIGDPVQEVIA